MKPRVYSFIVEQRLRTRYTIVVPGPITEADLMDKWSIEDIRAAATDTGDRDVVTNDYFIEAGSLKPSDVRPKPPKTKP